MIFTMMHPPEYKFCQTKREEIQENLQEQSLKGREAEEQDNIILFSHHTSLGNGYQIRL